MAGVARESNAEALLETSEDDLLAWAGRGEPESREPLLASLRDFFADRWWSSDSNRFYARPAGDPARGDTTRLVVRDYPFHQSSGKLNMAFVLPPEARRLFQYDLFHVLVQAPTKLLIGLVVGTYTLVVLTFALVYMAVDASDDTCHLGLDESALTFHTAFAFAVETQATIGYAIPSEGAAFFAGCPILPIVVYAHCLTVWVLNAALIGGTLARLSRANLRAVEVVFSDKACVQCIRGTFYLRFQVAELSYFRFHPAVEAHVRCYAVLHETDADAELSCPFQTRAMRLTHPDDTRGGMLFLPVPSAIMHAIDEWSPLYPPPLARHRRRREGQLDPSKAATQQLWRWPHVTGYQFPGLVQRAADLETMAAVRELAEQQRRDAPARGQEAEGRGPGGAPPRLRPMLSGSSAGSAGGGGGSGDGGGGGADCCSPTGREGGRGKGGTPAAAVHSAGGGAAQNGGGGAGAPGGGGGMAQPAAAPAMLRVGSAAVMDQLGLSSIGGPSALGARAGGSGGGGGGAGPGGGGDEAAARFREELRAHIARSDVEVVVLVEAIDPQTSNTFQARHSYKGVDIIYDHTFVPCMSFQADGRARFDLGKFHAMQPCGFNARDIGPVSSHA